MGAFAGEGAGAGVSNAGAGTGNNGYFSVKFVAHI
jgi:hypothetical protein